MKVYLLTIAALLTSTVSSFGHNDFDSYFYDDVWVNLDLMSSAFIFKLGGAGDVDVNLLSRDRKDREGRYYSGKYGPTLEGFFGLEMYLYFKWLIDLHVKFDLKGFEIFPAQFEFKKDIGGKGCNTFRTAMNAGSLDMTIRENIVQYYFSYAEGATNGWSNSVKRDFFPDDAEQVNYPDDKPLVEVWNKGWDWFTLCL